MKNIFLISMLVILTGCERRSGETTAYKTILIKSQGEIETMPDVATFYIDLYCIDKSVQNSKNCLVRKSDELASKLQSFGIQKTDILTTAVSMNKSYSWANNSSVFDGYRSSLTTSVTIKDISKLDEIYTELLENRNLELGGLSYTHSKIDSLQNEAYVMALTKSGVLADKLLTKLPESKKETLRIANVEMSSSTPNMRERTEQKTIEAASVAPQSLSINKGTIRVAATLHVEYAIH